MIPNNTKVVDVVNNFNGEKITMEIDPTATAHLMSLLTDLYSDPELACLREYSTNAWDSHIDAGREYKPIVVNTPNALSPYLTIQDFGVGMDGDMIRKIYSQYGRSTKREQTTTNGSMGIGAKAALGYTNQFTVTGIKDGVKTLVSVSRAGDGTGVMEIVYTGPTDEHDGVTIQIPTKSHHDFESKAKRLFMFWPKGRVRLNGKDPHVDVTMLSKRIGFLPEDDFDEDIVFMGNVAYPVESAHQISSSYSQQRVVFFSTMNASDEVVFTPSREGLIYNAITENALAGAREEYNSNIQKYYTEAINNAPTFGEAYRLRGEASKFHRYAKLTLPEAWNGTPLKNEILLKAMAWNTGRSRNAVTSNSALWTDTLFNDKDADVRIITGYKAVSVSSDNKGRIKRYYLDKDRPFSGARYYGGTMVYFIDDDSVLNDTRLAGVESVKWEDIQKATRSERKARVFAGTGFSYDGKYDVYDPTTGTFSIQDISQHQKIIYWSSAKKNYAKPEGEIKRNLHLIYPGYVFATAASNRHGKLEKEFGAKPFDNSEAEKIWVGMAFDRLTEKQIYIHASKQFYSREKLGLPYWKTEATAFIKALDQCIDQEYTGLVKAHYEEDGISTLAMRDPRFAPAVKAVRDSFIAFDVTARYPLVNDRSILRAPTALVEYINHEYNKKNGVI